MEIQLTKTKTITIGGGPKKKRHIALDVVGLDLFSGDTRGVPAVRLTEKKGVLRLASVGFVPPPDAGLPTSWEEAAKTCTWSLPAPFQAPRAALAVSSPDMFFAQTTRDAFKSDFTAGAHISAAPAVTGTAKPKKFSLKRDTTPRMKPPQAEQAEAPSPQPSVQKNVPDPEPGVPISNGGTRFVMKPLGDAEEFVLEAGLPEYQTLWLSRLLPEGKRPTAVSIQVRPAALTASILRQGAFSKDGATLALFLHNDNAHIVAYDKGDIILWHECPRVPGWNKINMALKQGLGLDNATVLTVLEDTLIDPRPALEAVVQPLLDELAVSRDYLIGKRSLEVKSALLLGIPAGGRYFSAISEDHIHLPLVTPSPFDGLERADKIFVGEGVVIGNGEEKRSTGDENAFLGALGAALAYIGEEQAE